MSGWALSHIILGQVGLRQFLDWALQLWWARGRAYRPLECWIMFCLSNYFGLGWIKTISGSIAVARKGYYSCKMYRKYEIIRHSKFKRPQSMTPYPSWAAFNAREIIVEEVSAGEISDWGNWLLGKLLLGKLSRGSCDKVLMQGKLIAVAYTLRSYWNQFSSWAEFVNNNRCISVRLVSEEVKSI